MKTHDDLPPIQYNTGPGEWADRVDEARKDPGAWKEAGEYHRSMVTYLRSGRCHGVDPAEIEVASRKVEGDRSRIFIRVRGE